MCSTSPGFAALCSQTAATSYTECTCPWLPSRPVDGDRAFGCPDAVARRIAAGKALSMCELPGPCRPALKTLGFAPASYPSRPRDAPVQTHKHPH